jgi:Brp/Blh family beta-carotene 15,15'-monooxygenase
MTITPAWQTWLFAATAIVAISMNLLFQPDLMVQLFVLVPPIAILGLPHGALDLSIAQALWPLVGWQGKARFVSAYVGLTLLVIGFWIVFPGPALFGFLIYSAFHFSSDWDGEDNLLRIIGGVTTVGAPALFWQAKVAAIFAYLAPEPAANLAALSLAIAGCVALILCVSLTILCPMVRTRATVEQGIIWIAAACLSPLVYFVIYFCSLHTVRHFTSALASLENQRHALRTAGLLTALTVFGGLIGFIILQKADTAVPEQSILQIVFIGIAALTVPHMLLVDRFQKLKHAPRP